MLKLTNLITITTIIIGSKNAILKSSYRQNKNFITTQNDESYNDNDFSRSATSLQAKEHKKIEVLNKKLIN